MSYKFEVEKATRATSCTSCRKKIEVGDLQFGSCSVFGAGQFGSVMVYHPQCADPAQLRYLISTGSDWPSSVSGYKQLSGDEQKSLQDALTERAKDKDSGKKSGKRKSTSGDGESKGRGKNKSKAKAKSKNENEAKDKKEKKANKKGKSEKKKKEKDPKAPKKPGSGYMDYCAEQRKVLAKSEPTLKGKDVMSKLGEMWKALSEDDKKKYQDAAKAATEKWKEELKEYEAKKISDAPDNEEDDKEEDKEESPKKKRKTTKKKDKAKDKANSDDESDKKADKTDKDAETSEADGEDKEKENKTVDEGDDE